MKEKLTKSPQRVKELGEVFTPTKLVNEMLDKLPSECWLPDRKFFEPSCGNGNFLVAILQRKLDAGHSHIQALSTIWGVDIMKDNVIESRKRMLQVVIDEGLNWKGPDLKKAIEIIKRNIKVGDTLQTPLEEIFKQE